MAPSAPISFVREECVEELRRLKEWAIKVKLGSTVDKTEGYSAGTIAERVNDIHKMFLDPEVKAIIATIGGYNANDLLDKLDYELIKRITINCLSAIAI